MEIDNRWIADYDKAAEIIKSEIAEKLPKFELIEENLKQETYYYYLDYKYQNMVLEVGGEQGYIMFYLKINETPVSLPKENLKFKELEAASENNFIIFIGLLKEYLEKKKLI